MSIPRNGPKAAAAARAMVATSQSAATDAGLRILEQGGNAVDAALAAATVLSVTEPRSTGVGGDLFALICSDGNVVALDAAGPAPAGAPAQQPTQDSGPESITVPGAVGGWAALAERYGTLGLDRCLTDAIKLAEHGFPVGDNAARIWADAAHKPEGLPRAPSAGETVRLHELAQTLKAIASEGPDAVYRGRVGEAIAAASWLDGSDLASFTPRWVAPLQSRYRDVAVYETPPPTQGVAALEGLGLLALLGGGLADHVTAVRLSLEDAFAFVRDGADVSWLLDADRLRQRLGERASAVPDMPGGTVHLCVVDERGMAVSLTQSIYQSFGSGVTAPGTGVVLNNRAACFSVSGGVLPGQRPYHTTIAGMLVGDGELIAPFGIMGGFVQAQAHVQFVSGILDDELEPAVGFGGDRLATGRRSSESHSLWQSMGRA